jgi:hypothetical protein
MALIENKKKGNKLVRVADPSLAASDAVGRPLQTFHAARQAGTDDVKDITLTAGRGPTGWIDGARTTLDFRRPLKPGSRCQRARARSGKRGRRRGGCPSFVPKRSFAAA